ncbi:MAG: hypothetical protein VYC41_04590 [Planctomycetota bacterium]|nr:hypothetical protein [Planctomycetota bacterium]MEE2660846.1 hypothetical protein [Planctomycetota bacterium]
MDRQAILGATFALLNAAGTLGQELPDPNPVPQSDGTNLWYVGNNTQYPVIQDVLDAVSDGDEIVIRAGLYVESLTIDNVEITLRPFVTNAGGAPKYEQVTFLNPTEGFNNDNGWALKMQGARGTYVGRPRQFTELENGLDVVTRIQPRDALTYSPVGDPINIASILNAEFSNGSAVMRIQSRTIDDVAIVSDSGQGTFSGFLITSMNGSGGGIIITGAHNQTTFVDCELKNLYSTGSPHEQVYDLPVNVITVSGDSTCRPTFHRIKIHNNDVTQYGVVCQIGADTEWSHCDIYENDARASDGTVMSTGGRSTWHDCVFSANQSGRGTVYWDAEGTLVTDEFRFFDSCFIDNQTVTNLYGGVAWVDHPSGSGQQPQLMFSGCGFVQNNGLNYPNPTDPEDSTLETEAEYAIFTPYFPEHRIGIDNAGYCTVPDQVLDQGQVFGDLNDDGSVDWSDLDALSSLLGTCSTDVDRNGVTNFNDLVRILNEYNESCP